MLSNDSSQARPIDGDSPKIPYQREAGSQEDDAIGDWTPVRRLVPASALTPTNNLQGDVLQQEVYEYTGGYGFKSNADGDAQATLRMQEIEAGGKHVCRSISYFFNGHRNDVEQKMSSSSHRCFCRSFLGIF